MKFNALLAVFIAAPILAFWSVVPAQAKEVIPDMGYTSSNIELKMAQTIRAVPCGGRIDAVVYNVWDWRLTSAIIDKANCGTTIRFITWYQKIGPKEKETPLTTAQTQIRDALKKNGEKFVACHGACLLGVKTGFEHQKIVAIDTGTRKIVISDSGNWTEATDHHANDRISVDDKCLYDSTIKHFDQMALDKKPKNPIKISTSCDKRHLIYWLPGAKVDPQLAWAKNAQCRSGSRVVWAPSMLSQGKKTKYGSGAKLVNELIRFKKSGADVRVASNKDHWSRALEDQMKKKGIRIYPETSGYRHLKSLFARGCSSGPIGFQGSATTTITAYVENGNQIMVTKVPSEVNAAIDNFERTISTN